MRHTAPDRKEWLRRNLVDFSYVLFSIIVAFGVGAIFISILGSNPATIYKIMFSKAFTSVGQVLRRTTVYIFTGLAVAIPVSAGMFNMGGEGQVAAGALVAAVLGGSFSIPSGLHPLICMGAAAIIGAFMSAIPALMKAKFGSSEVVSGIMVNYIVYYLLQYLVMHVFRGSQESPQTSVINDTAKIPRVLAGAQWSLGFFLAIGACLFLSFILNRTRIGLEMKSAGLNREAARYQGININYMSIVAMLVGGALAGLGGSVEVLGGRYLYLDNYFASYGYDGIAVSYMAKNNPLAVIVTAFLVSALKVGAVAVDRQTNINVHFATALQGMVIALLVTPYLAQWFVEKLKNIRASKQCEFQSNGQQMNGD